MTQYRAIEDENRRLVMFHEPGQLNRIATMSLYGLSGGIRHLINLLTVLGDELKTVRLQGWRFQQTQGSGTRGSGMAFGMFVS